LQRGRAVHHAPLCWARLTIVTVSFPSFTSRVITAFSIEAKCGCRTTFRVLSSCASAASSSNSDRKSTRLNSSHVKISYAVFCLIRLALRHSLFPYTTLFRSSPEGTRRSSCSFVLGTLDDRDRELSVFHLTSDNRVLDRSEVRLQDNFQSLVLLCQRGVELELRSEEHTSELQSRENLVCRLLLDSSRSATLTLSLHDALPIFSRGDAPFIMLLCAGHA